MERERALLIHPFVINYLATHPAVAAKPVLYKLMEAVGEGAAVRLTARERRVIAGLLEAGIAAELAPKLFTLNPRLVKLGKLEPTMSELMN